MKTCYLCGKEILTKRESSKDHIMSKQLFRALIDKEKKNLITLPVHERCNEEYQEDEKIYGEYMRLLTTNIAEHNPNAKNIFTKNLWDSDKHPGNLKLTQETVARQPLYKTEEGIFHRLHYTDQPLTPEQSKSINNITWKIVRGLYYRGKREGSEKRSRAPDNPQTYAINFPPRKYGHDKRYSALSLF